MTRHTLSVLVENKFGVLARIAGLFSGRGYNIHTLNVAPSHDPNFSRMTIVVSEKENVLDQIIKQLQKLINVVEVVDYRDYASINRELILIRVSIKREMRAELVSLCRIFNAEILDLTPDSMSIEVSGDNNKIDRFLLMLDGYDIQIMTRTGMIALPKPE